MRPQRKRVDLGSTKSTGPTKVLEGATSSFSAASPLITRTAPRLKSLGRYLFLPRISALQVDISKTKPIPYVTPWHDLDDLHTQQTRRSTSLHKPSQPNLTQTTATSAVLASLNPFSTPLSPPPPPPPQPLPP